MPEMDGYEATMIIRQLDSEMSKIVIVAMTANAMKEDRDRCIACGMDDYLSKPIRKEDLARKLAEWEKRLFSENAIAFSENITTDIRSADVNIDESLSLIDWTYIDSIADGSEEFKLELLQTYFESTSENLELLKIAIAKNNYHEIATISHSIKGASSNLGVLSITAIASDLEQLGRNQKLDNTKYLFQKMQDLFLQFQDNHL